MPLEVMVERQRTAPANASDARMLRLSVEAGLHFLLMLDQQPLSKKYRPAFIARFALQRPDESVLAKADEETRRFVETMVGRAPDARRLAELLRTGGTAQLIADTTLKIVVADRAEVEQTATRWLEWYDALFSEPVEGIGRRVEPAAHGVRADRGRAAVGRPASISGRSRRASSTTVISTGAASISTSK